MVCHGHRVEENGGGKPRGEIRVSKVSTNPPRSLLESGAYVEAGRASIQVSGTRVTVLERYFKDVTV